MCTCSYRPSTRIGFKDFYSLKGEYSVLGKRTEEIKGNPYKSAIFLIVHITDTILRVMSGP